MQPCLLTFDADGKPSGLQADRYDALAAELQAQWLAFNRELKQGKPIHLEYDKTSQKLTWRKPKGENQKTRDKAFYEQLPFCDLADVFRFVNGQWQFLSALTPLQPRYAKKVADADSLMAVIVAQAMNHGNQVRARASDIPYHVLDNAYLRVTWVAWPVPVLQALIL